MFRIIMSENQYNILSLRFEDKLGIIEDVSLYKDIIFLSLFKKSGLYKVRYYPYKEFKFHVYKGTVLEYVSNNLKGIKI